MSSAAQLYMSTAPGKIQTLSRRPGQARKHEALSCSSRVALREAATCVVVNMIGSQTASAPSADCSSTAPGLRARPGEVPRLLPNSNSVSISPIVPTTPIPSHEDARAMIRETSLPPGGQASTGAFFPEKDSEQRVSERETSGSDNGVGWQ